MRKKKGVLIVLDGIDGVGKSTQIKLLLNLFKKKKVQHKYLSFPQYQTSFYGRFIKAYLSGQFGRLGTINPYFVAFPYAFDRVLAREKIVKWLAAGNLVLLDRYICSNIAYLGAYFPASSRKKFAAWVEEMEYQVNKMPKENLVIFLSLPAQKAQKLLQKRRGGSGRPDIHESSLKYQQEVSKNYLSLARKYKHWIKINCADRSFLKPPLLIHHEIVNVLKEQKFL